MGNQLFKRQADALRAFQEIEGGHVVAQGVYPRADGGDLLGADVEVGVDGGIAAVDEEAKLAKSAAVADELIDVGVSNGRAGALEGKVRIVTATSTSAPRKSPPLALGFTPFAITRPPLISSSVPRPSVFLLRS